MLVIEHLKVFCEKHPTGELMAAGVLLAAIII